MQPRTVHNQAYFLDKIPQPTPTQSWPKVEFSGYLLEFFVKSLEFFRKILSFGIFSLVFWDVSIENSSVERFHGLKPVKLPTFQAVFCS